MLNENKNIDQIFREKLGEYQKTPPTFLWTNIQRELDERRKDRRMIMFKTVGIAAALILAFLAGWWMTNPADTDFAPYNRVAADHGALSNTITPSTNENATITDIPPINSNHAAFNTPKSLLTTNRTSFSNLTSPATFAPNTSILGNNERSAIQKSDELELFDTEKDFLDQVHQNFKAVKKLTDWIATVGKDSVVETKSDSKAIITSTFKNDISEGSVTMALNNPARIHNGRWSLKAEFAPVFNSQAQNSTQRASLVPSGSQNYKPQETSAENTFSGGMVAGYKISKRLVVKSGIVYNTIRQSTRNVDFTGGNPFYNVSGNATLASTPAGQVNLNKTVGMRGETILNSNYQLDNTAKYSTQTELKQDIGFIEIPVQATYKLIDSKFNVGLTGGISTNFLVGNKAVLSENGNRISNGETANLRSVVYSGTVGLEMGYEITNRVTLTVEPRLKHFVNSLSTSRSIDYKPYQIGIVTGLTYSFN